MSGNDASANTPANTSVRAVDAMTFEELVDELTDVTAQMDDGAIGIERAADLYDRASALHAAASARLVNVEARLEQLRGGRS
jgi:exodeoxyribonuclease VII small subunit